MNPELRHWLFMEEVETEREARKSGYHDIAKSCREAQINLIRDKVLENE